MADAGVRFAGRITDWNDDKGYGFVMPSGGGDRAFVHINDFQRGSRRPVDGDLISYRLRTDARGRPKACEVRHAGQRIEVRKPPSRVPRAARGGAALVAIGGAFALGWIPLVLAGLYAVASLVSYLAYRGDKTEAGRSGQRTPEDLLHFFDLVGGWPGALVAQQQFRHKTVKQPFQFIFWFTVIGNLVAAAWLLDGGGMPWIQDVLWWRTSRA